MAALWLEIPDPGVGWINANDRLHHHEKARRTAAWREATAWRAKQARLPHQSVRVRILAFVCLTTAHDFDAGNWHPTAKAAIDGLRDAGVLDEDSNAFVVGPDMRQGPRRKPRTLVLTITDDLSAEEAMTK